MRDKQTTSNTMTQASLCSDFANELFSYAWNDFEIESGKTSVSKFIKDKGLEKCKKSEATLMLRVGDRCTDSGYWITGKCANYWLRPVQNSGK